MLKGIILVSGISVALLVGTSESNAYDCGWMGTDSHDSEHTGWCWSTDNDHIEGCYNNMGCGMMHLGHIDLSDEDQARIEEILTEARAEIEEILSEYESGCQSTFSSGCQCCH
ncbi:MAG: hypothetical protein KAR44_14540 [Candidatus Aegiribacteria sp.]|nr:hypothetical protein [Candidatus Aegiribacteria sp.]